MSLGPSKMSRSAVPEGLPWKAGLLRRSSTLLPSMFHHHSWRMLPGGSLPPALREAARAFSRSFISASRGGSRRLALTRIAATEKPCCEVRIRIFFGPAESYFGSPSGIHSQRAGSLGPPCCACHLRSDKVTLSASAASLPGSQASGSFGFLEFGAVSSVACHDPSKVSWQQPPAKTQAFIGTPGNEVNSASTEFSLALAGLLSAPAIQ